MWTPPLRHVLIESFHLRGLVCVSYVSRVCLLCVAMCECITNNNRKSQYPKLCINAPGLVEWISANVLQTARVHWRVPVLLQEVLWVLSSPLYWVSEVGRLGQWVNIPTQKLQGSPDKRWKALLTYSTGIRSPASNGTQVTLVGDWHTIDQPPEHPRAHV